MLFNSYEFILLFLPVTLMVYFWLARSKLEVALSWLVLASLFFYGWWNPKYLLLIVASMLVNFLIGKWLAQHSDNFSPQLRRSALIIGIVFNLGLLAYYKYAGFFLSIANDALGTNYNLGAIILPLAISFFTFQQIAFLIDAYRRISEEYNALHYALFVTFFPQLIAGPIVHHKEMLPQFMRHESLRPRLDNISVGLGIFVIGLFKKTVLADSAAMYATPVFVAADGGQTLHFFQAWSGALAYTMQLYFDFSGYSDMAIGAARMFGIRLPLNFHSPYKARNIVDFWRRWHITLSRFLRDYLYFGLGGNRKGPTRRYVNLLLTMLIGGLWHGAGWTFVAWGGLHGLYLVINHTWHQLRDNWVPALPIPTWASASLAWSITFIAVVIGWVFFRATSFHGALAMLEGMAGMNGVAIPNAIAARMGTTWEWLQAAGATSYLGGGSTFVQVWLLIPALTAIALLMPNTQQIMANAQPALGFNASHNPARLLRWQPNVTWGLGMGIVAALGFLALARVSEFLYFQF